MQKEGVNLPVRKSVARGKWTYHSIMPEIKLEQILHGSSHFVPYKKGTSKAAKEGSLWRKLQGGAKEAIGDAVEDYTVRRIL